MYIVPGYKRVRVLRWESRIYCFIFILRFVFQQGGVHFSHFQMLEQHVGRGFQVYRLSLPVHVFHIVEKAWRSSAAGDDDILELSYLVQDFLFNLAESVFSVFREYLGDGPAVAFFDIPV